MYETEEMMTPSALNIIVPSHHLSPFSSWK